MKYRITAVRIAGAKPLSLDRVEYTYNKVHLVTCRDHYNSFKKTLTETIPKAISVLSGNLRETVERINESKKEVMK